MRSSLDLKFIIVAASAVATAVLGDLPKVKLLLSKAAIAIATTVDFNVDTSSWLLAKGVSFCDKHIHKVIVTVSRVSLWNHVGVGVLLLTNVNGNITILLFNEGLRLMLNLRSLFVQEHDIIGNRSGLEHAGVLIVIDPYRSVFGIRDRGDQC